MEAWIRGQLEWLMERTTLVDGSIPRWREFLVAFYNAGHCIPVDDGMFCPEDGMFNSPDRSGADLTIGEVWLPVIAAAYRIVLFHPDQLHQPNIDFLGKYASSEFRRKLSALHRWEPPAVTEQMATELMNLGIVGERLRLWQTASYVPLP